MSPRRGADSRQKTFARLAQPERDSDRLARGRRFRRGRGLRRRFHCLRRNCFRLLCDGTRDLFGANLSRRRRGFGPQGARFAQAPLNQNADKNQARTGACGDSERKNNLQGMHVDEYFLRNFFSE